MNDPAELPAVKRLAALPIDEGFAAYFEIVEEAPDIADVAALALREQARGGRVDKSHAKLLGAAVDLAPNLLCVGHLAKALAALGRDGVDGAAALARRLREHELFILDDVDFWSFDGCIWALGYLGGPEATAALDDLDKEAPRREVRSSSVYQGRMPPAARTKQLDASFSSARELLAKADPGVWRARKMALAGTSPPQTKTATKPWMSRK